MAYLLVALAFIASIMFYSLYPRTDKIEIMGKAMAKTTVFELLAQHSAALDAATVIWKTSAIPGKQNEQAYKSGLDWLSFNQGSWQTFNPSSATQGMLEERVYEVFMPPASQFSEGDVRPQTFLLCVDNETASYTSECAKQTGLGTTDLLITIVPLEALKAEYGPRYTAVVERALGESAFLSTYDHVMTKNRCRKKLADGTYVYANCPQTYKTEDGTQRIKTDADGNLISSNNEAYSLDNKVHLTTNCGIISYIGTGVFDEEFGKDYDPNADYVLTNTRYETVAIPRVFTNNYGKDPEENVEDAEGAIHDMTHLACITELHSTYAGCCNIEIPKDSVSCVDAGCTWDINKKECNCPNTYKAEICGDSKTTGKFGCEWNAGIGACLSVCANYETRSDCEGRADGDLIDGARYGCVWNPVAQKCETSCGGMPVRPALQTDPTEL